MSDSKDAPSGDFQALVTVLLDRFNRIEDAIQSDRINSDDSRRRLHEKVDGLEKSFWGLDSRMETMEKAVTSTSPFFTEFQAYRERVIGAGIVGRWLWWIGGIILTAAASIAATYAWLASHFTIPK
jgi:hypothetical protein